MKQIRRFVMTIWLCGAIFTGLNEAKAEGEAIPVYLDGNHLRFEVPPILENGTTLVQFRPIFERLGLTVGWDEQTREVTGTKRGLVIKLGIDEPDAIVNNQPTMLELAPRLVDGHTFVPLRFVSEASGAEVVWDGENHRIYIRSAGSPTTGTGSGDAEAEEKPQPDKPTKSDKGTYTYPNGDSYTGQLANGKPEGKGKLVDAGGKLLFDGTMADGEPVEGRYKTYYANGRLEIDGRLQEGVLSGAGKQYTDGGKLLFSGMFAAGEWQSGTLYAENGDKYTGEFKNGKPEGKGKLLYKNGDTYEGSFSDGMREGAGIYTTSKGDKLEGTFRLNLKHGVIRHYDKKGNLLSVSEYANDVLVSQVNLGKEAVPVPGTSEPGTSSVVQAEKSRHEKAVQDIKERYQAGKKLLDDQIAQLRKEQPGLYASQAAFEQALNEAALKQTSIQSKLSLLGSDRSQAGEAARAELNKQLEAIKAQMALIQQKGVAQRQIEHLKEQLSLLKSKYDAELKHENTQHAKLIKTLQ
ncbi:Uncharacterized conserved protein [Paenibacillus sp. UNCCL117]|uniref:stalk domain-containing protein n=1 Tax=unclassified Paenibacillus TaxID=185978 RepID=UPI00088B9D0A|nr:MULTISPECIES: stalk domain-containing protein [unclassified Paenibacillus]SDC20836.1 Uncharacterized conserved protein [Paenibacillus sp. cl123]SFW18699.1 Uncharacterized conserved protein [Paenibacillus sp. UNCCL117]